MIICSPTIFAVQHPWLRSNFWRFTTLVERSEYTETTRATRPSYSCKQRLRCAGKKLTLHVITPCKMRYMAMTSSSCWLQKTICSRGNITVDFSTTCNPQQEWRGQERPLLFTVVPTTLTRVPTKCLSAICQLGTALPRVEVIR